MIDSSLFFLGGLQAAAVVLVVGVRGLTGPMLTPPPFFIPRFFPTQNFKESSHMTDVMWLLFSPRGDSHMFRI